MLSVETHGCVIDARFIRGGNAPLVAATLNEHGSQRLVTIAAEVDGSVQTLESAIRGRIDLGETTATGLGFRASSVGDGTRWGWLYPDGSTAVRGGEVEPLPTGAITRTARRVDATELLTFVPSDGPVGAVVTLHGGPESTEFDELRYWGLYRELLGQSIMVVAVNYAGSLGFGEAPAADLGELGVRVRAGAPRRRADRP